MKIIHVANHASRQGNGIVNAMVDLACTQAQLGHQVVVLTGGGDFIPLLNEYGVRHIEIEHRQLKGVAPFKSLMQFARLLRRERPDVVHCHMVAGLLLAKAARTLRLAPDFLLVSTIHNEFQRSATLMKQADRVVGVSEAVTASMIKRGIPKTQISTIANGVIGSPRVQKPNSVDAPVILPPKSIITVAGMYKRKGIDVLLHAFKQTLASVAEARLFIVGDGPDRAEFEGLAKQLALGPAVNFMGMRHDASALMHGAEIFVLASRKDPCPLVIVEAREMKCAIVASDVDGIPQQLEYGRAGKLVPPENVEQLSAALTELLTDPVKAAAMREAAGSNLEWLSIDRATQEYLSLYTQYMRRKATH